MEDRTTALATVTFAIIEHNDTTGNGEVSGYNTDGDKLDSFAYTNYTLPELVVKIRLTWPSCNLDALTDITPELDGT